MCWMYIGQTFAIHLALCKNLEAKNIRIINTANGSDFALTWNGGIANVIEQVVNLNRSHVFDIQKRFDPVIKKIKNYFTFVNHEELIYET